MKRQNHADLSNQLDSKHENQLGNVRQTKKRIVRNLFVESFGCFCVSKGQEEEKVACQIPIQIMEVRWITKEKCSQNCRCVLDERVNGHDVEQ